jgi:hypothetical protein
VWGIQEWNQATATFTVKTPIVITDPDQVVDADAEDYAPLSSVGSIGDYAVVAIGIIIFGYYKNSSNAWVQIGDDEWKASWPTLTGTASPNELIEGYNLYINDELVAVGATNTVAGFAAVINAANIQGVSAAAVSGRLALFADSTATNDGSSFGGGVIAIDPGPNNGAALLTSLGITSGEYRAPIYLPAYSYQVPRWRTSDTTTRPTGSVWNNMSAANSGINISIKRYSAVLGDWIPQTSNAYIGDFVALNGLDPSGGGKNIPVGTTYLNIDPFFYSTTPNQTATYEILSRYALGATVVTGTVANPTFVSGNSFTIRASETGSLTSLVSTVVLGGTTPAAFVAAVSAANVPNVSASVNSAGNIVFTHSQGGSIVLEPLTGTPLTTAGFTLATPLVRQGRLGASQLILSNWVTEPEFTYTASDTAPDVDPADGRLWFYSSVSDVDIMIQDNGTWQGYQNVGNDVRGFDLALTNASGPIIAATAPTTQNDASESPLQFGDLWIDSSDLENYPAIYRWQAVAGTNQWVSVDTTDQVTENGVLFADARWAPNGTTDPISDPFPTIESLLTSDYLDLDAPDPSLYPQGMLLFNTRRSGYNVKSFQENYFNAASFPDDVLPSQKNTWLTASGNKNDGSMWSGRQAQRQIIVAAMKSGIDTSLSIREEQVDFNLIATPAYPELTPNMIALSNERSNTLFVVADTPLRLDASGNSLVSWATNNGGLGLVTQDGQIATSNYAGAFYPSCQTTDLSGNTVVAPPSHMMVRTILRSDAVSYPWLAPAGTRRGVVDNALAIGYIDSATGEFVQLSMGQALRDILYERNVNPITFIPGVGITNFGNKTTTVTTTALDRINVARLVAFLRGRLEQIGKLFLFEPNDEITRAEITNTVNSLMIDLISKRAIYDYLVVCDNSNNTPARIDRNELWVDIAIEPVKAVEFIYIPLRIRNTGEISGAAA